MQEIVNGQTTAFAMDLNTGLTQVLSDGTNTYIYGNGRIAQVNAGTEYFLGDALGSVRQLTNNSGAVTYASAYDPYGVTTRTYGASQTAYGYTNEYTDSYIKLIYLRSRLYDPATGRFTTRDSWQGDYNRPLSLNRWMYVEGNPINLTDPTGLIRQGESAEANAIVKRLKTYRVFIHQDWGGWSYWYNDPVDITQSSNRCLWDEGQWELKELKEIKRGVVDTARAMGGFNNFNFNLGYIDVYKTNLYNDTHIAHGGLHVIKVNNTRHDISAWTTAHELGHSWNANFGGTLSANFYAATVYNGKIHAVATCNADKKLPGCNTAGYFYVDVLAFGADENMNASEDFANSVAAYVYPEYAQKQIKKYDTPKYREYLYYSDYRTTLRWILINALIRSTNQYRSR